MKRKKINKLSLVFSFVFLIALIFVISASATIVDTIDVDALSQNSSGVFNPYGSNYLAITDENFMVMEIHIFEYDGDKPYYKSYVVSNIEAFQTQFTGLDYYQFLEALQNYSYYGIAEYQYQYLMSWQPPVSQEQLQNATTQAKQEVWQEVNTINRDMYINGFSTNGALLNDVVISSGATLREFIGLNYIAQRNIDIEQYSALQGNYNTLQGNYNTLQGNYNTLQGEFELLEVAYSGLESNNNTLTEENQQLRVDIQNSYNLGYSAGMTEGEHFENGITSVLSAPMYFLGNVLQFDVFGINLFSLVCSIFTLLIIAFVIKKLAN